MTIFKVIQNMRNILIFLLVIAIIIILIKSIEFSPSNQKVSNITSKTNHTKEALPNLKRLNNFVEDPSQILVLGESPNYSQVEKANITEEDKSQKLNKTNYEILLLDGDNHNPISNTLVIFEEFHKTKIIQKFELISDEKGIVNLNLADYQKGDMFASVHGYEKYQHIILDAKSQQSPYTMIFYKGSNILINVFDKYEKAIDDFSVYCQIKEQILLLPIEKIENSQIYQIKNVPIGKLKLIVRSKNYLDSDCYIFPSLPQKTIHLDIPLKEPRTITFQIELPIKPKTITAYVENTELSNLGFKNEIIRESKTTEIITCFSSHENFDKITLKLAESGLYTAELPSHLITNIILKFENYLSQKIDLHHYQYFYEVKLEEKFKAELTVLDKNHKPVPNIKLYFIKYYEINNDIEINDSAKVDDTYYFEDIEATTNHNGKALVENLRSKMNIKIRKLEDNSYFYGKNYLWSFDANKSTQKTIIIDDEQIEFKNQTTISIEGVVTFNNLPVLNAQIIIDGNSTESCMTDENGKFKFEKAFDKNNEIEIFAILHNLGISEKIKISTAKDNHSLHLELKNEKSLSLKIVNPNGKIIPDFPLIVYQDIPYHIKTNTDGIAELFNLKPSNCSIKTNSFGYQFAEPTTFQLPNTQITLMAKQKKMIKVNLPYNELKNNRYIQTYIGKFNYFESYKLVKHQGSYYIKIENTDENYSKLCFSVLGRIFDYHFFNEADLENQLIEIDIKQDEGAKLIIKVIDGYTFQPIRGAKIEANDGKLIYAILTTNQNGETEIENLPSIINLSVNSLENNHTVFKDYSIKANETLIVKVFNGGKLVGTSKNNPENLIYLGLIRENWSLFDFRKNNFELANLPPAKYKVCIMQHSKETGVDISTLKTIEVEIKDNEVHEIDMDNLDLLIKK